MKPRLSILELLLVTAITAMFTAICPATATAQVPAKRAGRSPEQVAELRKKQTDLLAKWDEGKVDPLDSKDLLKIISSIGDDSKIDVPDNGTKVEMTSLPAEIQTDLHNAIAGLIRAYRSELQTTAVIIYMRERDEVPSEQFIAQVRSELLKQGKLPSDDIKQMPADDVLRLFRGDDIKSHWAGIQPNESTVQLWKTSEAITAKAQSEFGKQYWEVFPRVARYVHAFRPTTFTDAELKTNGSVLVADITLLIRLDDTCLSKPAPHFIRFWFCSADKKWHPFQLVRCNVDTSTNKETRIVF